MRLLQLGLERAYGGMFYKALLYGHPGVGKSSELCRLIKIPEIQDKFLPIRISAVSNLDPNAFKSFDILLFILSEIAEKTQSLINEHNLPQLLPESLLQDILRWFASEKTMSSVNTEVGASISSEMGLQNPNWLNLFIRLASLLKGEIKYASNRRKELIDYRYNRLSDLIDLMNRLLDTCNDALQKALNKEWLIIGDDFERSSVCLPSVEDFFISHSNVLRELRVSMIFTIPTTLVYGSQLQQLPFSNDRIHCITDIPVFNREHKPDHAGRNALKAVLSARMNLALFEEGQANNIITASGGNLRDLFTLVSQAGDIAFLRNAKKIASEDINKSVIQLRTDYERSLGESPLDKEKISYKEKAEKLKAIYKQDPDSRIPDATLHSLLRTKAVQEFNGERWFGVHPLVVDILKTQGYLEIGENGKVPGESAT